MTLSEKVFWDYYNLGREDDACDYKREIKFSDKEAFAKFLKHVLAISNFGGGYLLLGVSDDRRILGIEKETDQANLGDKVEADLGFPIDLQLYYFTHQVDESSVRLGLVFIPPSTEILLSVKDLPSANDPIVRKGDVYYRRNTRSRKATAEDYKSLLKRISQKQASNTTVIENEASALGRISKHEAIKIAKVLQNRFEINAAELGFKLWEVWKFKSRYSKLEFAKLMRIEADKIDKYFDGEELMGLDHIILATKLFDLPPDYFFRPTYNMRFPFWQEDIVKYSILALVQPKAKIEDIDNNGSFYSLIINELADKICELHVLLFPANHNEPAVMNVKQKDLGQKLVTASNELRSALADKYYKLLEQYPRNTQDRSLVPAELILEHWFFATGEYIARLITEGISEIDLTTPNKPVIKFRFEQDLERAEVKSERYDSENLEMRAR